MPTVICLKKSDVSDFAQVFVLANTPLSLFSGMVRTSGMERLRNHPSEDLVAYFDYVTARAERSEYVVAVAYAVLCALVLQSRDRSVGNVDPSRLEWGEAIWAFMSRANIGTSRIHIPSAQAQVSSSGSPSVDNRFQLYDGYGGMIERNRQ